MSEKNFSGAPSPTQEHVGIAQPLTPIEAVAEAWASVDGRLHAFRACKADTQREEKEGRYGGYMADAASLIERLLSRGYAIVRAEQSTGRLVNPKTPNPESSI